MDTVSQSFLLSNYLVLIVFTVKTENYSTNKDWLSIIASNHRLNTFVAARSVS